MSSIGTITSTTQAVYSASAVKRVLQASDAAPTRGLDRDGDRSPPGTDNIWASGKGGAIDVYA
jgi:hypothetical protein